VRKIWISEEIYAKHRLIKSESWLKEKYLEEGMSLAAIARACGRSPETIRRWMKKTRNSIENLSAGAGAKAEAREAGQE